MAAMFSPPQDVQPTIASVARKRSGSRRAASPSSCGKSLARVVWKDASDTSRWRDDQPVKHNIWRVLHPGDEVEGLVGDNSRGGSSPLGRTSESPAQRGFLMPTDGFAARHGRSGGVYSYRTADGLRWRFVYRRSDGTQTTKRGFMSERAARDARRRLVEQVERGEVHHTKETFGDYWERWLARRRPYLEPGTWNGYEIAGRKRLVPAFGGLSLGELSVDVIREFIAELAEEVEAGELAAKTVNNALGTLVVCLNSAVDDGLLAVNPALRVQRLPPAHIERDYLRLDEIPRYLDACSDVYRPLAELLIGSGLRISEALALRVGDLELEAERSSSTARGSSTPLARRSRTDFARSRSAPRSARSSEIRSRGVPSLPQARTTPQSCLSCRSVRRSAATAVGLAPASAGHSTATPSRATGTRKRSKTPRSATYRYTRCATQRPRRGLRPATR